MGKGKHMTDIYADIANRGFAAVAKTRNEHEMDPARQGRLAVAADDGFLVGGTPAEQGIVAAMIEDRARNAGAATRTRGNDDALQNFIGRKTQIDALLANAREESA